MPFKWDQASERNLLLFAISTLGTPSTAIWDQVADKIDPDGNLNGNACSQKFYKLKKESEKLIAESNGSVINTDPATPVKATKTPATRSTGGRKRKNADADGNGETATPTKRRNTKKTAPEVKVEVKAETVEELESEAEEAPAVKAQETADASAD